MGLPDEEGLAYALQALAQGSVGGEFDLHLLGQLADAAVDHGLEQALLAAELGVERGERTACTADDFGHIGLLVAELEEHIPGGFKEGGAAQFGAAGFRFRRGGRGGFSGIVLRHHIRDTRCAIDLILGSASLHFNGNVTGIT